MLERLLQRDKDELVTKQGTHADYCYDPAQKFSTKRETAQRKTF